MSMMVKVDSAHEEEFLREYEKMEAQSEYEKYENRLKTFTNWPNDSPVFIKDLAEAGFYYKGEADFVYCFQCGIKKGNWKENEQPLKLHAAVSENCPYLLDRSIKAKQMKATELHQYGDPHQNAKPHVDADPHQEAAIAGCSAKADEIIPAENTVLTDMKENSSSELPEFFSEIGYSASENRELSIKKFRKNISDARTKTISDAGLFYNETGDCFECYHCHTQFDICDILSSDDPVNFHAELLPSCKHISLIVHDRVLDEDVSPQPSENHKRKEGISPGGTSEQRHQENTTNMATGVMDLNGKPLTNQQIKSRIKPSNESLKIKMPVRNSGPQVMGQCDKIPEANHRQAKALPMNQAVSPKRLGPSPGSVSTEAFGNLLTTGTNTGSMSSRPYMMSVSPSHLSGNMAFLGTPLNSGSPIGIPISPSLGPKHYTMAHQDSVTSNASDDEIMLREPASISLLQRQSSHSSETGSRSSDLKTKYGRLHTFLTWPQDASIQPLELCEAGFYYTGVDDGVKCFKCAVALRSWEDGDTAWGEHKKWSPQCPLVREHETQRVSASPSRQMSGLEAGMQMRREIERSTPNFAGIREMQNFNPATTMNYPFATPFLAPPNSEIIGPSNLIGNGYLYGVGNANHAINMTLGSPHIEQNEMMTEPVQTNNRFERTSRIEPIGPLSLVDFDKLLEAGFSVEIINKAQNLGYEKHGQYFESLEATADAILYVVEHGSLDGHCMPKKQEDADDACRNQSALQDEQPGQQTDLRRELDKVKEMQLCKICMDEQVGVAFHPCGHLFCCPSCSMGLNQCPICRATIESSSRVYLS